MIKQTTPFICLLHVVSHGTECYSHRGICDPMIEMLREVPRGKDGGQAGGAGSACLSRSGERGCGQGYPPEIKLSVEDACWAKPRQLIVAPIWAYGHSDELLASGRGISWGNAPSPRPLCERWVFAGKLELSEPIVWSGSTGGGVLFGRCELTKCGPRGILARSCQLM
jgi:hypothetical protein